HFTRINHGPFFCLWLGVALHITIRPMNKERPIIMAVMEKVNSLWSCNSKVWVSTMTATYKYRLILIKRLVNQTTIRTGLKLRR
ncbi:hypothetical protein, partial [Brevibacillus sp. AY1]|uniref:hypothetical protein n=1 Tax=Brevibacillus sp. AY1 TaxID=2807621 RepID=UPI002458CAE2